MLSEQLNEYNQQYPIYHARRSEFQTSGVPFRISPTPFQLTTEQTESLHNLGADISAYLKSVWEIYQTDERAKTILDKGKPEIFLIDSEPHYLFVRPDLIISNNGFTITEIETSPFGLALAEMLNRAYKNEGYETLVEDQELQSYIQDSTPTDGVLIHTTKTQAYQGQLSFLADEIFQRNWRSSHIQNVQNGSTDATYRGFYLSEYLSDPSVFEFMNSLSTRDLAFPSLTPQFEEKALLALLWDKRWEDKIQKQVGNASFQHLRKSIPKTWIVGEEAFFSPGLPPGVNQAVDLAGLSRSKRTFVLKSSGFSTNSSWAEGIYFLHTLSKDKAQQALQDAQDSTSGLHIVQDFHKPIVHSMQYMNGSNTYSMAGKVRLTPYYTFGQKESGKLVGIKATAVDNSDIIHAGTHSINTAVSQE